MDRAAGDNFRAGGYGPQNGDVALRKDNRLSRAHGLLHDDRLHRAYRLRRHWWRSLRLAIVNRTNLAGRFLLGRGLEIACGPTASNWRGQARAEQRRSRSLDAHDIHVALAKGVDQFLQLVAVDIEIFDIENDRPPQE